MPGYEERLTTYDRDGLVFDVSDQGRASGEPIVLLHGFPQTSTEYDGVRPALHDAGYRTLAPNQRGYSPRARPEGRRHYRLDLLVADVAELIEKVGGRAHVVGHDWGAVVGWSLAASRPDLVASYVAVSVPHPRAFTKALKKPDQLRRSWYMAFFQLPFLPELLLSQPAVYQRFLGGSGMDRDSRARYRAEMVDGDRLRAAINWYRAMPLSPPSGLGRRVRVPTTFVWSDADVALGRAGAELTASYVEDPSYRFEELSGVSHWIPDEQPDRLAELILERVRATPLG